MLQTTPLASKQLEREGRRAGLCGWGEGRGPRGGPASPRRCVHSAPHRPRNEAVNPLVAPHAAEVSSGAMRETRGESGSSTKGFGSLASLGELGLCVFQGRGWRRDWVASCPEKKKAEKRSGLRGRDGEGRTRTRDREAREEGDVSVWGFPQRSRHGKRKDDTTASATAHLGHAHALHGT